MTKQANIDKAISNIRGYLEANPTKEAVWVSQNDTDDCCKCSVCRAFYEAHGGKRSSTLVNFVNAVSDGLAEDYPNLKIITLAYNYTLQAPTHAEGTQDMTYRDNVIIYFCPLRSCANHPYYDTSCEMNAGVIESYNAWNELCQTMWFWDYSTNFQYGLAPFPSLHTMQKNVNYFATHGVYGAFNNAVDCKIGKSASGEFGQLRAYLISELYKNPLMTAEEYDAKMNGFLKAYYGAGWKYIRQYIDFCEEAVGDSTMGYYMMASDYIDMDLWAKNADNIIGMFSKAYDRATTQEQKERVELSLISALYMTQVSLYDSMYTNGTAQSKEDYCAANDILYSLIETHHVRLREQEGTTIVHDRTQSPESWTSK